MLNIDPDDDEEEDKKNKSKTVQQTSDSDQKPSVAVENTTNVTAENTENGDKPQPVAIAGVRDCCFYRLNLLKLCLKKSE